MGGYPQIRTIEGGWAAGQLGASYPLKEIDG